MPLWADLERHSHAKKTIGFGFISQNHFGCNIKYGLHLFINPINLTFSELILSPLGLTQYNTPGLGRVCLQYSVSGGEGIK